MKFQYIIIIAFIIILGTSCKKSFLDRIPKDQPATSSFWNTEKDAILALNGCYALSADLANDAWYMDGFADNSYNQYPWESPATVASSGNIDANTDFGYNFTFIRRCNNFLDNIDRVSGIPEQKKKEYIAEIRTLRAYNYYILAQLFGSVPLLTKITDDRSEIAAKPETEVIKFVTDELTAAAADLPVGTSQSGRITKGAALAFLSRVQLAYSNWTAAATAAKSVMDLNTYGLFVVTTLAAEDTKDDYSSFITFTDNADKEKFYKGLRSYEKLFWAANENNKEVIFSAQYIANSPYSLSSGIYTLMMPATLTGWSSITPTVDMVNAYWNRDGSTFIPPSSATRAANYNNGNPTAAYFNEFKNRDTRLYATILFPSSPWENIGAGFKFSWAKGANNTSRTGYNFRKLVDPNFKQEWGAPQDYPIIRYAEILLNYAEALNETGGPSPEVYDALDLIRSRAGMPVIVRNQSQASLRDIIRNERRIELAGEGLRYTDIRRWNIAASVIKTEFDVSNSKVQDRTWEARHMRLPYPQTAVDNNPLLKDAQKAKGY